MKKMNVALVLAFSTLLGAGAAVAQGTSSTAVDDTATVTEDDAPTTIDVRGNDTDPDSAVEAISSVTQPVGGAVAITNAGADLTYTPTADFCNDGSPTDDFTYTLAGGSSATVAVSVTCVDDASVAADDTATVTEDDPATTIDVRGNDGDVDSAVEAISSVTQPAGGAVAITNAGADLTYTPTADFCNDGSPTDDFTYTLAGGSSATVAVSVTCVDDASVAADDTATVTEDDPATTIDVRGNDGDVDSAVEAISSVTQPAGGAVAITNAGADLTYTPTADFCNDGSPTDDFTYTLAGGSSATVAVSVTCVDDASVAADDTATVTEDDPATTIDVRGNDGDVDSAVEAISSVTQPAGGAVAITNAGADLTYTPTADFCNDGSPTDDFTYTLAGGSSATVAVSVTCVDDASVAADDTATVTEDDAATTIDVRGNDGDVDSAVEAISSVTQPAGGAVAITNAGADLTYTPTADFCNDGSPTDDFTYTLAGGSSATVAVSVTCVDDPPVAVDDTAGVAEDDAATAIDVLANDTDIDAGPKTIAAASDPLGGTVVVAGDGLSLTYEPDPDFCTTTAGASDNFTYELSPGGSVATVAVTVDCAPDAVDDAATVDEDSSGNAIAVLANDDVGDPPATVTAVSDPANGSAAINGAADGVEYTPDPDFCNTNTGTTDDFTYTVTDADGDSGSATVQVTVDCAPDAAADAATVDEDSSGNAIAVLANDDVGDTPATVTAVSDPANGSAAINGAADGVEYTPDPDFCSTNTGTTDDFTYTVTDADGDSATETVAVTVTCVNDVPSFAAGPDQTVDEDSPAQTVFPWATLISVGPANEADQNPTFTVTGNTNPGLFASAPAVAPDGTLTYTPAADSFGSANVTVTLADDCGGASPPASCGPSGVDTSAPQTFTITVDNVNDPPSFISGGDVITETGTGEQTVAWATGIDVGPANENQTATFTTTSDCPSSLILNGPVVDPDGTFRFTPVDFATGSCTVTTSLSDGVDSTGPVVFNLELVTASRPTADSQSVETDGGNPLTIVLTGSDPDGQLPLSFQVIEPEIETDVPICVIDGNACEEDLDCDGGPTPISGGDTCTGTGSAVVSDSGPFRGTLDTTTPPTNPDDVSANVIYTPNGPTISQAVVIATDSFRLSKFADVLSGDAVVNGAGGIADIERSTSTPAGFAVKADSLNVHSTAAINGSAECNGGSYAAQCAALTLPVYDLLPPFLVGDVDDTNDISVPFKGTISIQPGLYGDIVLARDATLVFGPGKYSMRSLTTVSKGELQFSGATEVKIRERMELGSNVKVNSGGNASEVFFYVAGVDSPAGSAAAVVGFNNADFSANVYAPNGTISIGQDAAVTGAFLGRHVVVGSKATVALDNGFGEAPDQFAFEVTDDIGLVSERATVTINDDDSCRDGAGQLVGLAAFDGEALTGGAGSIAVTLRGCESSDVPVTVTATNGAQGTVSGQPVGPAGPPYEFVVTYTPNDPVPNNRDSFDYTFDNGVSTATATIEINRPSCSAVETSAASSVATDANNPLTITLSACDPDDGVPTITTDPLPGGTFAGCATCDISAPVAITDNRPGFTSVNVVLTHAETVSTATSFDFTATAASGSDTSSVAVEVNPVNLPPAANDDAFSGTLGGTLSGNVLANDGDPNLDSLTATLVGGAPAQASVFTLNPNGSFVYTHNGSGSFSDSFQYSASDGVLSDTATVLITIVAADITVSVSKSGPAGSEDSLVTSSPAGINCGVGCSADSAVFMTTASIRLDVLPAPGFLFNGWSGDADCVDGAITPIADRSCVANFVTDTSVPPTGDPILLTVLKDGTGFGTVTSSPAGIACGATCQATVTGDPRITLSATPAPGSVFAGFAGGPGGNDCADGELEAAANTTCLATFNLAQRVLTVQFLAGSGTVSSTPSGITSCEGDLCSANFVNGALVSLSARPEATSPDNVVWGGDCVPDPIIAFKATVLMTADASCTVAFN